MKKLILLYVALLTFAIIENSGAAIVNINGQYNSTSNPVEIFFEAGTYDVIPIGKADGGAYDAVSLHYAWENSWVHRYVVSSSFFNYVSNPHVYHKDALTALDHAVSTQFTLPSDDYVGFSLNDSYYPDNVGGISLDVNAVPIPPTCLLLLSGIVSLVAFKKDSADTKIH